ncbi:MAG: hypothetical protein H8D80_02565 [Proteobacteria bacterium]|nr:hypothetical protein [Pseudomonadota bacterium]
MKTKTKTVEHNWSSGVSPKASLSYEKYMKAGLEIISPKFSIRTYKLAPKEDYPHFERGKDLRVRIFFDGKYIERSEFLVEVSFWMTSNGNNEDRVWMRHHADQKLKQFHDAREKGRKTTKKKKK